MRTRLSGEGEREWPCSESLTTVSLWPSLGGISDDLAGISDDLGGISAGSTAMDE